MCHVIGYLNNGESGPGISGGSAISPNGWIFNICKDPERCKVLESYDPDMGVAPWFVRLWEVGTHEFPRPPSSAPSPPPA